MQALEAQVGLIGAGPLGIEMAIALKREGLSFFQFDKGQIGQMIYNFPPQMKFFSSPEKISLAGIPIQTIDQQNCSREDYLAYLRSLIMCYDLKINSYEEVLSIDKRENGHFNIKTTKNEYRVNFIILATGATSVPRTLDIPGENLNHVSASMEDPHRYFGKKVMIVGGRNSAVETALRCLHAGAHVSIVYRRTQIDPNYVKYWLYPEMSSKILSGKITGYFDYELVEIFNEKVAMRRIGEKISIEVDTDFIIKNIGFKANMSLCKKIGLKLNPEDESPYFDSVTMESTVPSVFLLGNMVGGTQNRYSYFIDNTHEHVSKILSAICNKLNMKIKNPPPIPLHINNVEE